MIKTLITIVALFFLAIVQISFLPTWPLPIKSVNIILSLVIFTTVMSGYNSGLLWAFGIGLLLELYAAVPFGLVTLSLMLTVMVVNLLARHVFTNRSMYSLIGLAVVGTIAYHLAMALGLIVAAFWRNDALATIFDQDYAGFIAWQIGLNAIILSVIFLASLIIRPRQRNEFIINQ